MSGVEFDPATGRLRLDPVSFESMIAAAADPTAVTAELGTARVFEGSTLHPRLAAGVRAVRAPVCLLRVSVVDAAGARVHQGWVTGEAAAFLLSGADERYEFVVLAPRAAPALLARLLGLGAGSPREPIRVAVDPERVAALLAGPDLGATSRWLADLDAERLFAVDATWPGPRDAGGRALLALNGARGWARLVWASEEDPCFADSSTSDLWVALIDLLPRDDELGPAAVQSAGGPSTLDSHR